MKYYIETLGCFKNRVETEVLDSILRKRYKRVEDFRDANLILINSCTFIEEATQETIETILRFSSYKGKKLIVYGCFGQRYGSKIMNEIPEIDGVIGTHGIDSVVDVIEGVMKSEKIVSVRENPQTEDVDYSQRLAPSPQHFCFVKISDGCNRKCSFCVIPHLKGSLTSRSVESIVTEVQNLVRFGVKEINLVSQDTTSYGLDRYGEKKLYSLLCKLSEIRGLLWIRILYNYPGEIDKSLLDIITTNKKVCKYLDIPIQHISDRILKKMRREVSGRRIRDSIVNIREKYPDIFLRTTLIVGFPGETDKEFLELYEFVKEMRFERLGVFPFSREEGTSSFRMRRQIPESVKQERVREIMELQAGISLEKNREFVGSEVEVIIDEEIGGEYLYDGRTEYDAPEIDNGVLIKSGIVTIGDIVPVNIIDATEYDLIGETIH